MRLKIIPLLIIFMFMVISPVFSYSETPSQTTNYISEVEVVDFISDLTSAYTKGNADEYISFYSAKVVENGFGNVDSIKSGCLKELNSSSAIVLEIELSEIKTIGNHSVINGTYHKLSFDKPGGKTLDTSGDLRIRIKKDKALKIEKIDYDNFIINDYFIGPEDVIEISVWKAQDLSTTTVVRPDGIISLPLIGEITASGLTAKELGELIEQRLEEFKQTPTVSVIVKEINSKAVFITGEVIRPGKYPLRSDTTIIQAIILSGGFTQWAKRDKIVILRKNPTSPAGEKITVKYSDIASGKDMKTNILLKSGDTVIVP